MFQTQSLNKMLRKKRAAQSTNSRVELVDRARTLSLFWIRRFLSFTVRRAANEFPACRLLHARIFAALARSYKRKYFYSAVNYRWVRRRRRRRWERGWHSMTADRFTRSLLFSVRPGDSAVSRGNRMYGRAWQDYPRRCEKRIDVTGVNNFVRGLGALIRHRRTWLGMSRRYVEYRQFLLNRNCKRFSASTFGCAKSAATCANNLRGLYFVELSFP